ncbi:DUF4395 domain-containing protein [Sulfurimonas sediminis]|uniref:DUF4395 domain-containing protein n=1 Tax=Sulfurimonas sediminis TaxID=2590020 RepID=A0A7M1AZS5_9BACT|nr:DUF4395 domain-containing protein [Sulfurimonas sediminis]QOP42796.1 DUF4395 domain-containing protein [Sulfurimonas sediminis]
MSLFFNFGETVSEFDFKVINEREARASAGIMFLLGLLSLFSVYQFRTLLWAELFSITFIFEFFVRMFINPKYAPYMLLASVIVANQKPEWVEAKPKQFAWALGMLLGVIMTYYLVFDIISLTRLGICILCLALLFLESAFGICLGCLLYHQLNIRLSRCPGGVCEFGVSRREIKYRYVVLSLFATLFILTYLGLQEYKYTPLHKVVIIEG